MRSLGVLLTSLIREAIATVERVREAITQGKLPDEIVELLRAIKKREIRLGKAASA